MIEIAAQEYLMVLALTKSNRPEYITHAILRNHAAHNAGSLLDILRSACTDLPEHDFFSHTAAHGNLQLIHELTARCIGTVFLRQHKRVSACTAARNDRDLMHRICIRQQHAHERMTAFMISRKLFLIIAHDLGLAFRPCHDTFDGLFKLRHKNLLFVAARRQKRRLIHEIAEISTRKARRTAGKDIKICILIHRLALRVYLEDSQTAPHIRFVDHNLAIETTRAQKCRIQDIRTVRRCHDDDAFICRKAIHLNKQLIECLLTFIVAAAYTGTTLTAYRIDFIDENDTRRILLRLIKKITHTRSTNTNEHLDKIRAADGEERYTRFTRNSTCEQCLACTRRAKKQYALRNACTEIVELLRMLEELYDFLEFLLCFIRSGHILERNLHFVAACHTRTALAKGHDTAAAALRLLHDEKPHANEQKHRQHRREHRGPPWRFRRILRLDFDILRLQCLKELWIPIRGIRGNRCKLRSIGQGTLNGIVDHGDLSNLTLIYLLQELCIVYLLFCSASC